MCRGAAEVPKLSRTDSSLADGAAGFDAGGAEQAGDLLQVELDGVGAKNLRLREVCAGVAYLSHSVLKAANVVFQIQVWWRQVEAPAVNTFRDVLKS